MLFDYKLVLSVLLLSYSVYGEGETKPEELVAKISIVGNDAICSVEIELTEDEMKKEDKGEVTWYTSDDKTVGDKSKVDYSKDKKSLSSKLAHTEWLKQLNNELYCKMVIMVRDNKEVKSESFFFGLIVTVTNGEIVKIFNSKTDMSKEEVKVSDVNREGVKIKVKSNIPLICDNNDKCSIKVALDVSNKNMIKFSEASECESTLNQGSLNYEWTLYPMIDAFNRLIDEKFDANFEINADISGTNMDDYTKLTLPKINLSYNPTNRPFALNGGVCYDDPHVISNDGTEFEFHEAGEYLMYENIDLQFRVHVYNDLCQACDKCNNAKMYCIKQIYIQSIDDLVIYDTKFEQRLSYKDLSMKNVIQVPVLFNGDTADLGKATNLAIFQDGFNYMIRSHYGATVLIRKSGPTFFKIIPSKLDKNKVFGIFGNYNGDMTDDLKKTKFGDVDNINEYFKKYKAPSNNLTEFSNKGQYSFTVDSMKYCTCEKNKDNVRVKSCNPGIVHRIPVVNPTPASRILKPPFELNMLNYLFDPEFALTVTKTLPEDVKNTCDDKLKNDETLKKCNDKKIIGLDKFVENCKKDYEGTKLDIWANFVHISLLGWCKAALEYDRTNYLENGNKDKAFLDKLCLPECTKNGECKEGTCSCKDGFVGDDCSIKLSDAPKIDRIFYKDNRCDIKNTKISCSIVLIRGTGLSTKENGVKLLYKPVINATAIVSRVSRETVNYIKPTIADAFLLSSNLAVGKLNLDKYNSSNKLSVKYYKLSVTNKDETLASNEVDYAVFDSKCHDFDTKNKQFSLKDGTCDIEGSCYIDNEFKNGNETSKLYCNSKKNTYEWTASSGLKSITNEKLIISFLIIVSYILFI